MSNAINLELNGKCSLKIFSRFLLAKLKYQKLIKCFGVEVFDENYKPGILTLVSCIIDFLSNFSDAYTIVISYPDFMAMLKTSTLWGVSLQVSFD
jgi:hypothetical protein